MNKYISMVIVCLSIFTAFSGCVGDADIPDTDNVSYGMNTTFYNTTGYHYINYTMPSNSFGQEYVNVSSANWSYFWAMFRTKSAWNMQGWNPVQETWVDDYQGTDLDEYLNISRVRAYDNASEKVTLNFTSPYTTQYRFTFGIDARVLQYVNKTGQLEYELVYPINGSNESYTVFFNWSDLIPMLNNNTIRVNHGIKNVSGRDVFWFRIITNVNLTEGVSYLLDPTFGNENTATSEVEVGIKFGNTIDIYYDTATPSSSGTVDNITVYIADDVGDDWMCASLYVNSTLALVGQTEPVYVTSDVDHWEVFTFSSPPSVTSGTEYGIAVTSFNGTHNINSQWSASGRYCNKNRIDLGGSTSFPNPHTVDNVYRTNDLCMYASYTESVSNNAPTLSNESPTNNSVDVVWSNMNLTVDVNSSDGSTIDYINISISNDTGFLFSHNYTSQSNGTFYLNDSWSGFSSGEIYTWYVNTSCNGTQNNSWFNFTTEGVSLDDLYNEIINIKNDMLKESDSIELSMSINMIGLALIGLLYVFAMWRKDFVVCLLGTVFSLAVGISYLGSGYGVFSVGWWIGVSMFLMAIYFSFLALYFGLTMSYFDNLLK